jgi:RNA polymerase sigma-70 factor (ECF subfamily)
MELAGALCDPSLTPAAAATQREIAKQIEAAIELLPSIDQEILLMRHYEQLSNQDIAAALELTEPAASMRYLRALRRLREIIDQSNSSTH